MYSDLQLIPPCTYRKQKSLAIRPNYLNRKDRNSNFNLLFQNNF
jgi:hypothetical protein